MRTAGSIQQYVLIRDRQGPEELDPLQEVVGQVFCAAGWMTQSLHDLQLPDPLDRAKFVFDLQNVLGSPFQQGLQAMQGTGPLPAEHRAFLWSLSKELRSLGDLLLHAVIAAGWPTPAPGEPVQVGASEATPDHPQLKPCQAKAWRCVKAAERAWPDLLESGRPTRSLYDRIRRDGEFDGFDEYTDENGRWIGPSWETFRRHYNAANRVLGSRRLSRGAPPDYSHSVVFKDKT